MKFVELLGKGPKVAVAQAGVTANQSFRQRRGLSSSGRCNSVQPKTIVRQLLRGLFSNAKTKAQWTHSGFYGLDDWPVGSPVESVHDHATRHSIQECCLCPRTNPPSILYYKYLGAVFRFISPILGALTPPVRR